MPSKICCGLVNRTDCLVKIRIPLESPESMTFVFPFDNTKHSMVHLDKMFSRDFNTVLNTYQPDFLKSLQNAC